MCVLCKKKGGVTLKCADTVEAVHVSCAALAGFTVGFEIQTVGATDCAAECPLT